MVSHLPKCSTTKNSPLTAFAGKLSAAYQGYTDGMHLCAPPTHTMLVAIVVQEKISKFKVHVYMCFLELQATAVPVFSTTKAKLRF